MSMLKRLQLASQTDMLKFKSRLWASSRHFSLEHKFETHDGTLVKAGERELLHTVDIALSFPKAKTVSGLVSSPLGLKELRKKGFKATNATLNDARALLLSSALDRQSSRQWYGFLDQIMAAISSREEDASKLVVALTTKRFLLITRVATNKTDPTCPITKFGMDSMLAAEFLTRFITPLD
ncbi:hypothetical protein QBC37DRAFT_378572 [Rhypophila decipiens]|uniref:Uncharacterized protein n=1 Tax=Rhypophila decipiens TaxID=261697 RepID=A0AAN6XXW0_9PEZI|nr:hypothetical protein QBC37DRAFT_378572 [Rhypophila decipiens]